MQNEEKKSSLTKEFDGLKHLKQPRISKIKEGKTKNLGCAEKKFHSEFFSTLFLGQQKTKKKESNNIMPGKEWAFFLVSFCGQNKETQEKRRRGRN